MIRHVSIIISLLLALICTANVFGNTVFFVEPDKFYGNYNIIYNKEICDLSIYKKNSVIYNKFCKSLIDYKYWYNIGNTLILKSGDRYISFPAIYNDVYVDGISIDSGKSYKNVYIKKAGNIGLFQKIIFLFS